MRASGRLRDPVAASVITFVGFGRCDPVPKFVNCKRDEQPHDRKVHFDVKRIHPGAQVRGGWTPRRDEPNPSSAFAYKPRQANNFEIMTVDCEVTEADSTKQQKGLRNSAMVDDSRFLAVRLGGTTVLRRQYCSTLEQVAQLLSVYSALSPRSLCPWP